MNKIFLKIGLLSFILGLFCFASVVQATPITTYLNVSNVDLGLSGDFATVVVSVSGNTVNFSIDANETLLGDGTNFGIQRFGFNTSVESLVASDFSLPTGWDVDLDFTSGSNMSAFGLFDADAAGTGRTRHDPLEFSITNADISNELQFFIANADGYHYAAHIAGFTNATTYDSSGKITSAFFSDGPREIPPVPEPATLLLLGSGLLGLAGVSRKK